MQWRTHNKSPFYYSMNRWIYTYPNPLWLRSAANNSLTHGYRQQIDSVIITISHSQNSHYFLVILNLGDHCRCLHHDISIPRFKRNSV